MLERPPVRRTEPDGVCFAEISNVAHALLRAVSKLSRHLQLLKYPQSKHRDESRCGTQSACATLQVAAKFLNVRGFRPQPLPMLGRAIKKPARLEQFVLAPV